LSPPSPKLELPTKEDKMFRNITAGQFIALISALGLAIIAAALVVAFVMDSAMWGVAIMSSGAALISLISMLSSLSSYRAIKRITR
jgi:hypothetical protein